jgi:predicted O-methyltransferase YrrM
MEWLEEFFTYPDLLEMGHGQSLEDKNLGLGWLYYALIRISKPKLAVCIGSWRGFVPILLAKAMQDNQNNGQLVFIDPSLVDDFWADASKVKAWFKTFGIENAQHFLMTTQEFVSSPYFSAISEVGFLFVDGYHTAEQAKYDFESFDALLTKNANVLFHDSTQALYSDIYGEHKKYQYTVYKYMKQLKKRKDMQSIDFYEASGLTLFKKIELGA